MQNNTVHKCREVQKCKWSIIRKQRYNLSYRWNYIGDWHLLRAKFTNDWNFFVREVGRGRGVQERNLEVTEVSRRGGTRWCRHEAGLGFFSLVEIVFTASVVDCWLFRKFGVCTLAIQYSCHSFLTCQVLSSIGHNSTVLQSITLSPARVKSTQKSCTGST